MKFPRDLLRFLYWIYFKPLSLHARIARINPALENTPFLLTRSDQPLERSFKSLALFHILVTPWLLGLGTGLVLSRLGMDVNWVMLAFYLFIVIVLSLTFQVVFCTAFLLPFSIMVAIWSSTPFNVALGGLFSLALGLAYGLTGNTARWGLIASLVYGVVLSILLGFPGGLLISAAFLAGYFRIVFYLLEAPLAWILGTLAERRDASGLWKLNPVSWDELIWLPLPRLDRHLQALLQQNGPAAQDAISQVRRAFHQRWAAERILKRGVVQE
jgi:hypothetical protein